MRPEQEPRQDPEQEPRQEPEQEPDQEPNLKPHTTDDPWHSMDRLKILKKKKFRTPKPTPDFSREVSGVKRPLLSDVYYQMLRMRWHYLMLLFMLTYGLVNALFATLFLFGGPGTISGAPDHGFLNAFWFSVQTLSTIGYGSMGPGTLYANLLVTIESFAGLLGMAMATGLIFAKFSRPSARIGFSKFVVIHNRDGLPTLHIRVANERSNHIIEAKVRVSLLFEEVTSEGHRLNRLIDLSLVRRFSPMFSLTWTVMHILDEESPLYGVRADNIEEMMPLLIVSFSGIDDTFVAAIHERTIFKAEDVRFNMRFADILEQNEERHLHLNHSRLHDVIALDTHPLEEEMGQ